MSVPKARGFGRLSNMIAIAGGSGTESCVDNNEIDNADGEPLQKKARLLVERLGGILRCVVCLDTPSCAIFQCVNGHLICGGCYNHVVADARLVQGEEAKCPVCRVQFCTAAPSRNLAVEKAISELPAACIFCDAEFPRIYLSTHEGKECSKRLVECIYAKIGCPWQGPYYSKAEHEQCCTRPQRSGTEIMESLEAMGQTQQDNRMVADHMIELMSCEKVDFKDLQLQPYSTQTYCYKVLHDTEEFEAFSHRWMVRARIQEVKKQNADVNERKFLYQVVLMSHLKPAQTIRCEYMIVRGPFSDIKVTPKVFKYDFTEKESESPYEEIPLGDPSECNRLLAKKFFNFRLVMFAVLP